MAGARNPMRPILGGTVRCLGEWLNRLAAIGPSDRRARRFGRFGQGTCLSWPTGYVFGERWIHLGENTLVGSHVTLSAGMVPGQQMVTDPVVRIGDRCLIGRGSAIVGHLSIEVGDDVFTGMNVYVTDQNHGYEDVDQPIGIQVPSEEPVSIGAGSWIGSGVVILPGAQLGEHVVVAANSVVRGEVPSYSMVAGVPARVVRRYEAGEWRRVDRP
ncbi:MAG: sugar acetyltransferase [Acidimicrobiaceae bacterium]|nr:sugar acetyltransferase [Acidimicrobiaceae bacterium]|tara:strand:+ start:4631 stop:5272 length:642 start_codon:yes stop_codon:yes gene_type:complete